MKKTLEKTFDTVKFFKAIKETLPSKMTGMTLEQQKDFLRQLEKVKKSYAEVKLINIIHFYNSRNSVIPIK